MQVQAVTSENDEFNALARELGSAFVQDWWLNLVDGVERLALVDKGGQMIGGFIVYPTKLKGVSCLANPSFTPHIGLFYRKNASNPARVLSEAKEIQKCVAEYLSKRSEKVIDVRLPHEISDVQQFYWNDFDVSPRYTYRVNLASDREELLAAMDAKTRNAIKVAENSDIVVEAAKGAEILPVVVDILKGNQAKVSFDLVERIISKGKSENCIMMSAKEGEHIRAVSFCIVHRDEAYYLFGGNAGAEKGPAGTLVMWKTIETAKERGLKVFDFEGSMIPGVEKFFRGFGGEMTTYFAVQKIPLSLRVAAKLVGKKF